MDAWVNIVHIAIQHVVLLVQVPLILLRALRDVNVGQSLWVHVHLLLLWSRFLWVLGQNAGLKLCLIIQIEPTHLIANIFLLIIAHRARPPLLLRHFHFLQVHLLLVFTRRCMHLLIIEVTLHGWGYFLLLLLMRRAKSRLLLIRRLLHLLVPSCIDAQINYDLLALLRLNDFRSLRRRLLACVICWLGHHHFFICKTLWTWWMNYLWILVAHYCRLVSVGRIFDLGDSIVIWLKRNIIIIKVNMIA